MTTEILIVLAAVLVYITIVFAFAWRIGRLDIVDIAWGGAFIIAAVTSLMLGLAGPLQLVVTALVVIWGARLGYYILKRVIGSKEDPRYTEMRLKWKGNAAINAYTRVFLVQGILAVIVSAAVITINLSNVTELGVWTLSGASIWIIGFLFESIGDAQLKRHLANADNKGKLMTSGLWRYTRHPNYFGEATQWWGIWVIALSVPFGWLAIVSPLLTTYLLLFVSGVPLTERRFEGRPGWSEYKQRTSKFIPLPPRS